MSGNQNQRNAEHLKIPIWPAFYVFGVFIAFGLIFGVLQDGIGQFIFLVLVGLSVGTGFLIHARARRKRKRIGHKVSLALVGLSLFFGAGIVGRQSFQIEGFFFYLLYGVFGGVVVHYVVAKILGPLFFGRSWCAWGCWTWMVLDYLPYKDNPHQPLGHWSWLRVIHFLLSIGLVLVLFFGFDYEHGTEWKTTKGMQWFLVGNFFYYLVGVILAVFFKDNRAFCKYFCPITVILRASSRFSLLKVTGNQERCVQCGACTKACPMDINVSGHIDIGKRVLSPECVLCQSCIVSCTTGSLGLSIGLDIGRSIPPASP